MLMWLMICLLVCFPLCNGLEALNPLTIADPLYYTQYALTNVGTLSSESKQYAKELHEIFFQASSNFKYSVDPCFQSIVNFAEDFSANKLYPKYVLDSWGKPPDGILLGNIKWIGSFSECMSKEYVDFKGRYCFLSLSNNTEINLLQQPAFKVGGCFPNQCSESNISAIFHIINKNITVSCPTQFTSWSGIDIFALILCCLILVIAIFSTLIYFFIGSSKPHYIPIDNNADNLHSNGLQDKYVLLWIITIPKSGYLHKFISAFSIVENLQRVFNTEQKSTDIKCLHGMRFLSITWVMLGHSLVFSSSYSDNMLALFQYIVQHWEFQVITNATFSVDTFFFLSGLLVTYLGCRQLAMTGGKLNVLKLYVHRYLRLTPLYAFLILFHITLYPKFVEAPLWPDANNANIKFCTKYWYTNLLYFSNLYPSELLNECYALGWYLSNDFQFFILAPIFLLLLHKFPKVGIATMLITILSSMTITGAFSTYSQQMSVGEAFGVLAKYIYSTRYNHSTNLTMPTLMFTGNIYISDLYTKPWCRIGAYIIGMGTGYILHTYRNGINFPKVAVFTGWMVSIITAFSLIFGLYPSYANDHLLSIPTAAFYNAVCRPVWCFCLAWLTIACVYGYGGPVNAILSWKGFIPLSRLTFAIYLVHPLITTWYLGSSDSLFHFTIPNLILVFLGTLLMSILVAIVCAVLIEFPVVNLTKKTVQARKADSELPKEDLLPVN